MPNIPGIPTADQEALQAPSVDPIMTLANAAVFGPVTAGKGLLSQILLSATGGWLGKGQMGQWAIGPNEPQARNDLGDAIFERLLQGVTGGKPVETLGNADVNRIQDLNKVLNWTMRTGGKIFQTPDDIYPFP